jgi:hypothetical protein
MQKFQVCLLEQFTRWMLQKWRVSSRVLLSKHSLEELEGSTEHVCVPGSECVTFRVEIHDEGVACCPIARWRLLVSLAASWQDIASVPRQSVTVNRLTRDSCVRAGAVLRPEEAVSWVYTPRDMMLSPLGHFPIFAPQSYGRSVPVIEYASTRSQRTAILVSIVCWSK